MRARTKDRVRIVDGLEGGVEGDEGVDDEDVGGEAVAEG